MEEAALAGMSTGWLREELGLHPSKAPGEQVGQELLTACGGDLWLG